MYFSFVLKGDSYWFSKFSAFLVSAPLTNLEMPMMIKRMEMVMMAVMLCPFRLDVMAMAGRDGDRGGAVDDANRGVRHAILLHQGEQFRGVRRMKPDAAMRGGMALGSLLTGLMVHLVDVQVALLINGVIALCAHLLIRQIWLKAI
jgi:hypothetical protein